MRAALSLCLVLAMSSLACAGGSDENQPGDAGAGDSWTLPGDAAMADTAVDTAPPLPPELAALCAKKAAPLVVPGTTRCMGDLARATFLFGACSCSDLIFTAGGITFDTVNSTKAASAIGAVAANGRFVAEDEMAGSSAVQVKGSLWAAGVGSVQPVVSLGTGYVTGNVRSGGNLTAINSSIKGDAYVAGSTSTNGNLTIEGALHQPASSPPPTWGGGTIMPGGGVVTEPVSVPPPCNCSQPLPIASIIAATKDDNDNAALGLNAASLNDPKKTLTLGCGRFYFDSIKSTGSVQIRVVGPTAIFVAGDVDAILDIKVLSGGQLDLFVGGNVRLHGAWGLGSASAPANSRVYIAGSSVTFDGAFNIDSNVYAPNAELAVSYSAFSVRGSLYARAMRIHGVAAGVTYDQAVQELTGCQPPGGGCTSCRDCSGATPACKGGTCGKCTSDADCCAPLVCKSDGTCVSGIR